MVVSEEGILRNGKACIRCLGICTEVSMYNLRLLQIDRLASNAQADARHWPDYGCFLPAQPTHVCLTVPPNVSRRPQCAREHWLQSVPRPRHGRPPVVVAAILSSRCQLQQLQSVVQGRVNLALLLVPYGDQPIFTTVLAQDAVALGGQITPTSIQQGRCAITATCVSTHK